MIVLVLAQMYVLRFFCCVIDISLQLHICNLIHELRTYTNLLNFPLKALECKVFIFFNFKLCWLKWYWNSLVLQAFMISQWPSCCVIYSQFHTRMQIGRFYLQCSEKTHIRFICLWQCHMDVYFIFFSSTIACGSV